MKHTLVLSLLLAVPALAGTSQVMTESTAPTYTQDTWSWFVGGTGGYLFEADEDIYTFQIGGRSPWAVSGWNIALFAEVGWTENHDGVNLGPPFNSHIGVELDIVPVTFNVKFERTFASAWSIYLGGGLGGASISGDFSPPPGIDGSMDEWVFTGQVFTGIAYHVSETFEIFGGGRWIYFDDPGNGNVDLGNDWMVEGGIRFHF